MHPAMIEEDIRIDTAQNNFKKPQTALKLPQNF